MRGEDLSGALGNRCTCGDARTDLGTAATDRQHCAVVCSVQIGAAVADVVLLCYEIVKPFTRPQFTDKL